jgi:hypothetical protein
MDLRRIHGLAALAMLLSLLWAEASGRRGTTIFFNKVAALDLRCPCGSQDLEALLAGHGGEGENGDLLAIPASFLPAGLGGEGEKGCCASATGSRSVEGCHRLGTSFSSSSLTHHGGEREGGLEASAFARWCCPLPARCYFFELIHVDGLSATVIFLPIWRQDFNLQCGAHAPIPPRELEAFSPRSDSFPVAIGWTKAADHRRKRALELLVLAPRWRRLEDIGEW